MNEHSASPALGRRDFLKTGGAMVIGFSLMGETALAAYQPSTTGRAATPGPPPGKEIDSWLAIHEDNTATLYIGFVELGQGCTTALPQVAAEELDLTMDQIRTVPHDTNVTPNQGGTYSSSAIARGGPQVRQAAAEARQALLKMAAEHLGAPVADLTVEKGVVSVTGDSGRSITYGDLIGGERFELAFTGDAPVKSRDNYSIVATPVPRRDMPAKVTATYTHLQHLKLEGMLHGRVVRPRGQRAYGAGAKVVSVDENSISDIPGARVLRQKDFIGVVAEDEWDAVRAAEKLKVTWEDPTPLFGGADLHTAMREADTQDRVVEESGDTAKALDGAAEVVSWTAYGPYQSHAPFAPNAALADVTADSALVICSTQDAYNTRQLLAGVLGLPEKQIRVQYYEGAGTYGKSCYDDVAQAAALLSQMAGAPVRLQFMRWDEHGWDYCGPGHVGDVRVAADEDGTLTAYEYDGWSHHWSLIETTQQLATDTPIAEWKFGISQDVNPRVCGGMYKAANKRLINHRVPGETMLRAGWLRSPMDLSFAFVSEQGIDELAHRLGMDPYVFRKRNIADERWEGVLDAAAEAANWQLGRAAADLSEETVVKGRGIGLGTHLASWGGAVADITVNKETGRVTIDHLYGAMDSGLVVNPGNVEAQIEGQLVQTASRMLFEEVTFNETAVTSLDWNSYPVIRFEDVPEVTPVIVQRVEEPCSGAGEEVMAAACAAIANAFFDATGVRMDRYPFTPERVVAALEKA